MNSGKITPNRVILCCPLMTGAEEELLRVLLKEDSSTFVVAVDSGLKSTRKNKIKADLAVGDWDSLGVFPEESWASCFVHLSPKKNLSDLHAAILQLKLRRILKPNTKLIILGAQGLRLDHELAIIEDLKLVLRGMKSWVWLGSRASICFLSSSESRFFYPSKDQVFSVFPWTTRRAVVEVKGARYKAKDGVLSKGSHGLSNQCLSNRLKIGVKEGNVLILFDRTQTSQDSQKRRQVSYQSHILPVTTQKKARS